MIKVFLDPLKNCIISLLFFNFSDQLDNDGRLKLIIKLTPEVDKERL